MATPSGLQDRILKYMAEHDRVEVAVIAAEFGMERKPVSRSMFALSEKRKVFKVGGHGQHGIWSLHNPNNKPADPIVKGTRYVPEFRELKPADYDIRSHMRQALAGR